MKRIITLILCLPFIMAIYSQNISTPLFATFEDGEAAPFALNQDGPGGEIRNQSIDDNPLKEKNTTDKALKVDIPQGTEWWHKTYFKIADGTTIVPASENHKYLHLFMLYPGSGNGVEIGVFNVTGDLIYQSDVNFEPSTEWQDVVFDLTANLNGKPGITDNNIGGIWIRPYTGGGNACYVDEFELSDSSTPRAVTITPWESENLATFETAAETPFSFAIEAGKALDTEAASPASGINKSEKCMYGDFSEGTVGWSKITLAKKTEFTVKPLSAEHKYLHFLAYRNKLTSSEIQIENTTGTRVFQKTFSNTAENTWEEIILDLSASDVAEQPGVAADTEIGKIILAVNPGNWNGDSDAQHYYFDEFILSNTSDKLFTNGGTTALQNAGDSGIVIFTQENTIKIAGEGLASAALFDMNGRMIYTAPALGATLLSIDMDKGMYILKVSKTDGSSTSYKIIL